MWRTLVGMGNQSQLPLVDRLIPGGAEKFLRSARDRGDSYRTIARRLETEHDIVTTDTTVQRWCEHYNIDTKETV